MKKLFYTIIGFISHTWWIFWSNYRGKKFERMSTFVDEEDKVSNMSQIKLLLKKLYSKFKWTADGIEELWDCMTPPPQNYLYYKDGLLRDDCDGFHALVLHCLKNSGFTCYLLSVCAKGAGHCVLIFKDKANKWHVIDYTQVYDGFDTPEKAINNYNEKFVTKYANAKEPVWHNGIIDYDYTEGKFKAVNVTAIE